MKYLVYLHINKLNNKVYVGITKQSKPELRWRNGYGYTKCLKFYNAIQKYGWDNFKHVIFCSTTQEKAELLEQVLIGYYKRHNRSYNITDGGERNIPSMLGKHHTPEAREKIRQAGRRPCAESTKIKIGNAHRGKKQTASWYAIARAVAAIRRPVIQLTMDGVPIREFNSASEAEAFLNKKSHHISSCCRGSRKSAYGFKWMYKDEYYSTISETTITV